MITAHFGLQRAPFGKDLPTAALFVPAAQAPGAPARRPAAWGGRLRPSPR